MNSKQVIMKKSGRMAFVVGMIVVLASGGVAMADTIKMNDGSEISGKIVLEGSDFVKIELQTSATIKESKMIKKSDIKQILKTAPDDLEWEKIQKLVPTRSLTSASSYRTMIEAGPKAFIATYLNSVHKTKVSEILKTLNEELDKVERGYQKIEDEWFSPEDRQNFSMRVEAKKRYLAMQNQVAQHNLPAYVQAMRSFQILDENHFGSPGHAQAVAGVKELLPVIGQTATRFLRDVNARNQQFERDKELLDAGAKAQVLAAREREEIMYQRSLAADKAAGVKWVGVNIRSTESLTALITLVKSEIERLKSVDAVALKARAEKLYEADKLIAEDKLVDAKVIVSQIEALPGEPKLKSSRKKKKSSSSDKSPEKAAKSYYVAVSQKLADKLAAEAQATADAAAEAEAAKVVGNGKKKDDKSAAAPAGGDGDAAAKGGNAAATEPSGRRNILGVIAKSDETEVKEEPEEKKKKPTKKKKTGTNWDEKRKAAEARGGSGSSGGGYPIWVYTVGIAVVLGAVVGVMKAMGIGGAKE